MAKATPIVGNSAPAAILAAGASALTSIVNKYKTRPYDTGISVNGNEIINQKVNGHKITTNYNQSEDEQNLMDYTNKNLLSGLENINVFSDELQKNIQNQVKAYTQQGIRTINETYNPMFRELKTDIASRFGNIDNSVFLDNLNEIEKNRTNAIETLTENILAKQSELYETEMNNRYNYLNQLSSINQNLYSNMFKFLQLAGYSSNLNFFFFSFFLSFFCLSSDAGA